MYNIIPLLLIIISLAIIIFIVARKFSILANIDLDSIPAEKEAQVKEMIISNRFKRNFTRWTSKIVNIFKFIGNKISFVFKMIFEKLHDLKDHYKMESEQQEEATEEKNIKDLFVEFKELKNKGDKEQAERKLIDIIGLDSKNLEAWDALGELYYEQKSYEEARQTFEHLIKLTEEAGGDASEVFFNLALVYRDNGELERALENIKLSLKKHSNNPRYLDSMIEISIMNKNKSLALDAFKKLQEANPENQKLADWKQKIKEL